MTDANEPSAAATSPLADLLGPTLVQDEKSGGDEIRVADLARTTGTVVLYFSAHWCPPCRGFTPLLSEAYAAYKKKNKESSQGDGDANQDGAGFELVFVSSDDDVASFRAYHAEMDFPALPYEARDLKAKLSDKFGVQGIPHLVAVDVATGEEDASVSKAAGGDLRSFVARHGASAFPLTPVHVREVTAAAEAKRADALGRLAASNVAVSMPPPDGANDVDETASSKTVALGELLGKHEHVGLVYGDGDASDGTYGKILEAAASLGSDKFLPVYVGWTAYRGQSDHPSLWERFHSIRDEALTDEVRSLLGDVAGDKVDGLTVVAIKSKGSGLCGLDGTCEPTGAPVVASVDRGCRALSHFGAAAFPWDEAAIKNALEANERRAKDLKERLAGFDFLRDNGGGDSLLVRGTGDEKKVVLVDDLLRSDEGSRRESAVLGLYFSAHWCPPCRAFTPELLQQYEAVRAKEGADSFEVVFVSFDKEEEEFDEYYSSMVTPASKEQWLSLDYGRGRELANDLTQVFGVQGFPSLVLLRGDGTVLSDNARGSVSQYGPDYFPWDAEGIERGKEALLKKEEEAIEAQRNEDGRAVVRRVIGPIGSIQYDATERVLDFKTGFSTAVVLDDAAVTRGLLYYEAEIVEHASGRPLAQWGFSLEGALAKADEDTGEGAGDDGKSWGVCGFRNEFWHDGRSIPMDDPSSTGSWEAGDVIGFAANVDAGKIAISKNGCWSKEAGHGVVFENGALEEAGSEGVGIHPTLTGRGLKVRLNVLEKDFRFSKPSADVWDSPGASPAA